MRPARRRRPAKWSSGFAAPAASGRFVGEPSVSAPLSLRIRLLSVFVLTLVAALASFSAERPLVYPVPLETRLAGGHCTLDTGAVILLPARSTQADELLARL